MKLLSLTVEGMRGIEREEVPLGPVTAFWGPNGSGKTTMVGAIIYALTGRFPGLVVPGKQATSHDVILKLATDPVRGFKVNLMLDEGTIERSVSGQKSSLAVQGRQGRSKGNETAEKMLAEMVGDASWALDMFDPEKSVWRMSPEKRKAWAMGICASASGWTQAQLVSALGQADDDWDPTLHRDAGICLELNLDRLNDRIKSAQKVVREAVVITEGVSAEPEAAVRDAIARLESEIETTRAEAERLKRLLDSASDEQACIERDRRARAQLAPQIKEMKTKIEALVPPTEPEVPAEALATIEQIDMDLVGWVMEINESGEEHQRLYGEQQVCRADLATIERYRAQMFETSHCPFCGATGEGFGEAAWVAKIDELKVKDTLLSEQMAVTRSQNEALTAQRSQMEETHRQASLLVALYEEDRKTYAERCAKFEQGFEAMINSVQAMETQLATVPADRPDVDRATLAVKHVQATAALALLTTAVGAERQKLGVAAHRSGQQTAQGKAERRAEALKDRLSEMRKVRDRMLDDAVAPLRGALESLDVLCLNGWQWTLQRDGANLDMVMRLGNHRILPVETLSVGERYLATIALLVAKAMVQRERWSGLVLDNFEAVFPASARNVVLSGLVQMTRLDESPVDNVLVAGACDAPGELDGVLSYVRSG